MNFKDILIYAQQGSELAKEEILARYKPILLIESILNGVFAEDLYQELCVTLLNCIDKFSIYHK